MIYQNQRVLLASKHEKERVIRPVFYEKMGCQIFTSDFDTDQFGTFTGEIARTHSAYETCVLKAKTAAIATDSLLSLASEGSFGPHPAMPFFASAHEIMAFVDLKNNWVITEQLVTPKTNYQMLTLHPETDILPFLNAVKFPSHAVTLQIESTKKVLGKGIQDITSLENLITQGFSESDALLLATDMRAMVNPTRMEVLSLLAEKLVSRILNTCQACQAPGFGFITTSDYLACGLCGGPTSLHRLEIWGCVACKHQEKYPRQDKLEHADPTYCHDCNP